MYLRFPPALPAPNSSAPTAARLAIAAPSSTRCAWSRLGSSRVAWLAVACASSLQTADHTHPQKTTARMSHPISGAARPAPATAAAVPAAIAAPKDTGSFVRANVNVRGDGLTACRLRWHCTGVAVHRPARLEGQPHPQGCPGGSRG